MKNDDLWPKEIQINSALLPRKILSEQAQLLGGRTEGYVTAEVSPLPKMQLEKSQLGFGLNLVAPALNWYRVRICNLAHSFLSIYPVIVWSDFVMIEENDPTYITANDEMELRSALRQVFSSKEVKSAIESLIVQSDGLDIPSEEEEIPF